MIQGSGRCALGGTSSARTQPRRPDPELGERVLEQRATVLPFVAHAVDVPELGVLLVADPRVDQHQAVVVLDQEAAEREGNAVALVGRDAPLPQRLGHDAEHGAAIEGLAARFQCVTSQTAHLEGGVHLILRNPQSIHKSSRLSGNVMHLGPPPPRTSSLPSIVTTPRSLSPSVSSPASRLVAVTSLKPAWSSSSSVASLRS